MRKAYASLICITAVFIGALLMVSTRVSAQSTCDDPFKDAGTLRFSTAFWNKTDFCKHSIAYSEILSGGPPPDGIPPIDEPKFESIQDADQWLADQSPVIALDIDGDARAYPLAILIWHEIANDTVGQVPVAITYCPLCNSAIVFDRRVGDTTLRLGVSGNLHNSDMIMWDDQTQSWWQQLTGDGIVGFYTGTHLNFIPSQVVDFASFKSQYPTGQVLSRDTGFSRSYGENPYTGYDTTSQPFLFDGALDNRLPPTAHVLAGLVNGKAVAYPFAILSTRKVINDVIESTPVVAFWQDGMVSALDKAVIDNSRPIGTAALYKRELDGQTLTFRISADGTIYDEQTNSEWNVFGKAVQGKLMGKQLERLVAGPFFWFAWAVFYPETTLYSEN